VQPLAISHFTLANCLGSGRAATLAAMREERSGLARVDFGDVDIDTWVGMVPGLESPVRAELIGFDCRNNRLAELAVTQDGFPEAVAAAAKKYRPSRIGVFMGTSTSGVLATEQAYRHRTADGSLPADFHYSKTQNGYSLADFVQQILGLTGPAMVVSSACSSTAKVFGHAQRMIEAGFIDAAVVGGVDSLCLTTLYGFNSLGLVSGQPCRPFGAGRDGISIGEGAGFALLEKAAEQPRAPRLLGVGESSDAYHMSSPHPEGEGARAAMQRALNAAHLTPADIGYINLHGTATPANDLSEDKAVVNLFGSKVPASSTKGAHGHLLGAAGITEAIISLLSMAHGFMPAGMNTREVDPELRTDYLLGNREGRLGAVLSNSFGFGGSNCALVLGAAA
jgi:3-oxoacyl-[acyl-carrier-protein] synthase-1